MASNELERIYRRRFQALGDYRNDVWRALIEHSFQPLIPRDAVLLDLGCGSGEFINNVACAKKFGMDLNPDTAAHLREDITFLQADCSAEWPLPEKSLDIVFTSNFFEHLPDKPALGRTLDQCRRCLKPRGRLIAMGPNIKYVRGAYWDFWDHYLPLTELSLKEALEIRGFQVDRCCGKFLPYTMAHGPRYPVALLKLYLRLPLAWRLFGRQFLMVASKTS